MRDPFSLCAIEEIQNIHGFRFYETYEKEIQISFKEKNQIKHVSIPESRFHEFVKVVNAINLILRKRDNDNGWRESE